MIIVHGYVSSQIQGVYLSFPIILILIYLMVYSIMVYIGAIPCLINK
jgi:hypothetical protein